MRLFSVAVLVCALAVFQKVNALDQKVVQVSNSTELRLAVRSAKPNTKILLKPGEYEGGLFFENIKGGGSCLQFSEAAYLEIHNLVLVGARYNGLNIDDGGSFDTPTHHIKLVGITVRDIGPQGNCDGIKLSGVTDFQVENCVIERWGDGGQGIDMVGCHNGTIANCILRFEDDKGQGIVAKGGSTNIRIVCCRLEHAGGRAIQLGGSTGLQFFRPPLQPGQSHAEARNLTVEGCTIIGSTGAIAFVGVENATVRFNTIYRPKRWAIRILQETREEGFIQCCNGVFTDNLIVFRSDEWAEGGVNIGPFTAPHTFTFARNWWFCIDKPEQSRPRLPAPEKDGVYGVDPKLRAPEEGDLTVLPDSPARKVGAHAYSPKDQDEKEQAAKEGKTCGLVLKRSSIC